MLARSCSQLSDGDLTRRLRTRVADDAVALAELLVLLAEFGDRRLYAPAGYPSLKAYCVGPLHLSESAAGKRIWAARAARRFPVVLDAIAAGRVHLSAVCALAAHFTRENVDELLALATHKTRAEVELLLAHRFPKPDVPTTIRPLTAAPVSVAMAAPLEPGPESESSSPGGWDNRGPRQIRTRRFPPSGSSAEAARGQPTPLR